MLRIIHAGNSAADFETLLSHLTNDKIIFIIAGDGDNDIRGNPEETWRRGLDYLLRNYLLNGP